jgi:hypothetical protein
MSFVSTVAQRVKSLNPIVDKAGRFATVCGFELRTD